MPSQRATIAPPRVRERPTEEQTFANPQPFTNHQAHGGGEIFVLAGPLNANTDIAITHFLKRVPKGIRIWDAGTTFHPRPKRGTVAWTYTTATIQIDTAIPGGTNLVGKLI